MDGPRFRQLEHVADLRLAVWGRDEEELIRNALAGTMAAILGRAPRARPSAWREVDVGGGDVPRALVRALNESLFRLYTSREVTVAFTLAERRGSLGVAPLPPRRDLTIEIKAATFHDLAAPLGSGRTRIVVTLDV